MASSEPYINNTNLNPSARAAGPSTTTTRDLTSRPRIFSPPNADAGDDDERGILGWSDDDLIERILSDEMLADLISEEDLLRLQQPRELPKVLLPGSSQTVTESAKELGSLLGPEQTHFLRGGQVVCVVAGTSGLPVIKTVDAIELVSDLEKVARLLKIAETSKGTKIKPATCSEATAKAILACSDFKDSLPRLNLLSRCPVLIEDDGTLRTVVGYDEASGILAAGETPEVLELEAAVELLIDLLSDFQFATMADRSRALAAFIAPALVMGGLLSGRAALDLGEADDSQSGKGFRHKLTAAIYGQLVTTVVQQKAGVGSLEESFDQALISGKNFISLDNVRGKIDSPKIESFLTEDTYNARCAHSRNMQIDPRRVCVMFTSNKADMTTDLANRCACVRILKQPEGYQFRKYAEGNVLDKVRAQQPKYLGAVFAVVRAWHAAGKPRTDESRHDFKVWGQTMDWIVENSFEAGPLLDGHRETQARMTSPDLNWLRDVMIAVMRQGRASEELLASNIIDCLEEAGDIEIPGARDTSDLDVPAVREQARKQIGKRLKRCFGDKDFVELGELAVRRKIGRDEFGRDQKSYVVYRVGDPDSELPF